MVNFSEKIFTNHSSARLIILGTRHTYFIWRLVKDFIDIINLALKTMFYALVPRFLITGSLVRTHTGSYFIINFTLLSPAPASLNNVHKEGLKHHYFIFYIITKNSHWPLSTVRGHVSPHWSRHTGQCPVSPSDPRPNTCVLPWLPHRPYTRTPDPSHMPTTSSHQRRS